MTQNQQTFDAAVVGAKFKNLLVKLDNLLAQNNHPELAAIRKKLQEDLQEYQEQGIITVAFVGQYNAGKSTTISALTGRRDIRIHSDIATDKTSIYDWNSIKLIDTPGLFTDRKDHDEITYEAINKADLLVFCLTYMLFDSLTVENFKKLAYEKGYRWKMMLVINKMSDEAGEEAQKIANYQKSLAEALKPYKLDEFSICFIDAKDYCEGVDTEDDCLLEISLFPTFIEALNNFVERRAALARFDTPVRIALGCVDEAQLSFTRNSSQDSVFLEVLTRLTRTVRKERARLRTNIKNIALEMSSEIAREGTNLAAAVGTDEEFAKLNLQAELNLQKYYEQAETKLQDALNTAVDDIREHVKEVLEGNLVQTFIGCLEKAENVSAQNLDKQDKQAELNLQKYYEQAETKLQDALNAAVEDIREHVKEVLEGNLVQTFIGCLEKAENVSAQNLDKQDNLEQLKGQVDSLKVIAETAGVQVKNLATRGFIKTAGQGFLRSVDVAGSSLHQSVLAVGKFAGFKFKLGQAIGIAKNIGNAAKFLGPALALVSVAMDFYGVQQEDEKQKKMADVRRDITSQFQAIAKDLENQIESQVWQFEQQVYGEIEKKIADARQKEESAIAASNTWVNELLEIRKNFEVILRYITKATQ
jgi:GTP-binding protein EngB required for normal cell division